VNGMEKGESGEKVQTRGFTAAGGGEVVKAKGPGTGPGLTKVEGGEIQYSVTNLGVICQGQDRGIAEVRKMNARRRRVKEDTAKEGLWPGKRGGKTRVKTRQCRGRYSQGRKKKRATRNAGSSATQRLNCGRKRRGDQSRKSGRAVKRRTTQGKRDCTNICMNGGN